MRLIAVYEFYFSGSFSTPKDVTKLDSHLTPLAGSNLPIPPPIPCTEVESGLYSKVGAQLWVLRERCQPRQHTFTPFRLKETGIVCVSNGDGRFTGLNSAGGRKKKEQKNRCVRHVQCSRPKTLESGQFKSSIYKISFPSFIFLAQALQTKPGVSALGGTCGGND